MLSFLRHPSWSRNLGEWEARRAAAQAVRGEAVPELTAVPEETGSPPKAQEALGPPGQPLDGRTRADFEARFGHDFSRVRVHADAGAARSAGELRARAYTFGQDIVFGSGRYQPGSTVGRSLIAHELAHVVQQGRAGRAALQMDSELESFPEDERKKVRVLLEPLSENDQAGVESAYLDKPAVQLPQGMTVQFGASVGASSQDGLRSVVDLLIQGALPTGTSITLAIGGAGEVYRFTRVERPSIKLPGAKAPMPEVVVVEKTGAVGVSPEETSETALKAGKVEIRKVRMKRSAGWTKADWAALSAALDAIPEAVLKEAAGVQFLREAKKTCGESDAKAGTCNPDADAETASFSRKITFFDRAFRKSTTRHGTSTSLESTLIHEIGHLVDNAALVTGVTAYQKSSSDSKAQKKLLAARSRSGLGWAEDIFGKTGLHLKFRDPGDAPAEGSFRDAAIQDGLVVKDGKIVSGGITAYGQMGWGELFAECYMLYFTDPDLLKAIRPNLFKYFETTWPQKKK